MIQTFQKLKFKTNLKKFVNTHFKESGTHPELMKFNSILEKKEHRKQLKITKEDDLKINITS